MFRNTAKAMLAADPAVMQNLIQDSLKSASEMEIDFDPPKATSPIPPSNNKPEEKHEPMEADEANNEPHEPAPNTNQVPTQPSNPPASNPEHMNN